jgi:hypothetical protein
MVMLTVYWRRNSCGSPTVEMPRSLLLGLSSTAKDHGEYVELGICRRRQPTDTGVRMFLVKERSKWRSKRKAEALARLLSLGITGSQLERNK